MSTIDWREAAVDFEPDGSLRDIYIRTANTADWQAVLDHVRAHYGPVHLTVDGVPRELPPRVDQLFAIRRLANPEAGFSVGGVHLACHFFATEEIEFDLSPEDVTGPPQFYALSTFLEEIGRLTGKAAILTPENLPDDPILRFDPHKGCVEYLPDSDARAG
jgi:hypothetical protein